MAQIQREGRVTFGDASLFVCEEGISAAREAGGWEGQKAWERQYKRDVFARIVQAMRRIGWTVTMPEIDPHDIKHYGGRVARWSAESKRHCVKGNLKADLSISGRSINLEFFQNVNAPDRPDHDGRYQSDKEFHMPYLMRLEMERTRRKVSTYLCNVFAGYRFEPKKPGRMSKRDPRGLTAMAFVQARYDESWHFKGDWEKWVDAHSGKGLVGCFNGDRKTADGALLEHGQRVYFADRKGRVCTGVAYYNINNMWWVVSGKYAVTNEASFELYAASPGDLRRKRNERARRKRLETELNKAVAAMDFRRAEVLRDLIFPRGEPLFVLWHSGHEAYHCAGFSGYAKDQMHAGKFTRAELERWEDGTNKIVAFGDRP